MPRTEANKDMRPDKCNVEGPGPGDAGVGPVSRIRRDVDAAPGDPGTPLVEDLLGCFSEQTGAAFG